MKKNLIALAVAGALAAPLAAQAEVTVSGVLQAEFVNVSSDDNAPAYEGLYLTDGMTYGAQNSSGAGGIFFSAAEDLGGGLKGIAKYGLNVTGDADKFKSRDAYVGLSGGFGTVLAGRMSTPYKSSTVKWDPFLATFMQARGNGGMTGSVIGHSGYLDNVVAYANQFGNATFVAGIGLDEGPDQDGGNETNAEHAFTASLNVPVGPVELAVAYLDASEHTAVGYAEDVTLTKIGAKWTSGAITVAGQYENLDEGVGDGSVIYLTGSYEMGANTFSASYGLTDQDVFPLDFDGDGIADAVDEVETTYFAIGMKHAFSKTTSAHLGYRMTSPDGKDIVEDADESVIGVGMRVAF